MADGDLCPNCNTPNARVDDSGHALGGQPFHQERECVGCGRVLIRDVPGGVWELRDPEPPAAAH